MDDLIYERLNSLEDRHWWFEGRRAVIWALLGHAQLPHPARVLDVGCGTGRNLQEFAPLGEITGIEPSASAVEFCHARGLKNAQQATVEHLPFEDETFDVAFAFDVLEHLDDDVAGLAEIKRVVKPDGWFVATVPAYRWMWSSHDEAHHHRRRYTRLELVERVVSAGWRPVFASYFNTILLPAIAAVRVFHRALAGQAGTDYDLTSGGLNRALGAPMRLEARLIARGIRLPAGVSIGIACRSV
jgi:SAM-dependent methyltransferase